MPRMRPAVRVWICAPSSCSPDDAPCADTIASIGSCTSKRRGYGSTPSLISSSRLARRWTTWSDSWTVFMSERHSFPWQRAAHRVEHTVDEPDGVVGAERARQLQRLVDDHLRWRLRFVQKFVDRHPQDQAIEH